MKLYSFGFEDPHECTNCSHLARVRTHEIRDARCTVCSIRRDIAFQSLPLPCHSFSLLSVSALFLPCCLPPAPLLNEPISTIHRIITRLYLQLFPSYFLRMNFSGQLRWNFLLHFLRRSNNSSRIVHALRNSSRKVLRSIRFSQSFEYLSRV